MFSTNDLWKGIILYGLNQATYKMALAQCLIRYAEADRTEVLWSELAADFLDSYSDRLKTNKMPQQATYGRMTKLERICLELQTGSTDRDEAIFKVGQDGFNDVIPRFQTIGKDKNISKGKFYEFDFGKRLTLTDELIAMGSGEATELFSEIDARWSLLEGAFSINQSAENWTLANDIRQIFLACGSSKRENLTNNIPFLLGYQGNVCFYCSEPLSDDIHVDHVLPRQVVQNDHIWNLALAHEHCNLQKSDKLIGEHFLKKLIFRNENIMGSNHPWKRKIELQLGSSKNKRKDQTLKIYEQVKLARGLVYWGGISSYNPENDPFFKKFVTRLNNN